MDMGVVLLILIGVLVALLFIGLEIGASIGLVTIIGLLLFTNQPLLNMPVQAWEVTNSFILTAVPLFILMGEIFNKTGIANRLFWAVDRWLGWLPGGIACTVIGACACFAAISGSSVAGAATMGSVAIPSMKERGYNMRLSFGVIASGGTLGILIPPSIIMIVYGAFQGLSIGRLFASGMVPGLILAGLFLLFVILGVKKWPHLAPPRESYSWKSRVIALRGLIPTFIIIGVVLGGVFAGIMTPTEAAGFGCVAVIILGLFYRQISWSILRTSIASSVRTTVVILLVAVAAKALAFVIQVLGLGETVNEFLLGAGLGKYVTLALIYGLYIILGCFFEGISMMLLTLPFITPIISGLGLSLYWFCVPLVIMVEASLITPPVGLNLYVLVGLAPEYNLIDVAKGALPFMLPMILVVALVTLFPVLVLWLPNLIYG